MKLEKITYPRHLATRVLTRVLSDKMALDEALETVMSEVPPNAWGWLQDVCSGTIRWKGRLDGILDSVAVKKKPTGWLRKALLLASYQLVAQDRVHPGSVVSETVSSVKAKEGEIPARFANACLRKVAEHALEWRNQPFPAGPTASTSPTAFGGDVMRTQAAWASLPEWLWSKLVRQQGPEWASEFAQACLDRPSLWIRSKKGDWNAQWAQPGPIPYSWKSSEGGSVAEKPDFPEGQYIVQDISSQFLIQEVVQKIQQGSLPLTVLDLCAAPGGKSIGLAWNGLQVRATEKLEKRVPLLAQSISRAAPEVEMIPWEKVQELEKVDLVWVDAPCTGTGILRRHPDVRWLRQESELSGLIRTQRELIRLGWDKVRSGGHLVYSVCSILKEEGPEAIEHTHLPGALPIQEWFLCPQNPPFGDGFWAVLLKKA